MIPVGPRACQDGLCLACTALPHGPFARPRLCCPQCPCYYGPIRQSRCHSPPCRFAACAPSPSASRPSLLWSANHSLGATTSAPEPTTAALARYLDRRPLAFALGRGLGSCSSPYNPLHVGCPFRRCSVRSPLRPQDLLALLSGRTCRPRGLLPELSSSLVTHRGCQASLRSQTGQLLRRDFHPLGRHRYRLHLPTGRHSGGLGRTARGTGAPDAARLLRRACVGVVGLCRWAVAHRGGWVRRSGPCPRPYLFRQRDQSRGPSLRRRSSSPPSPVLRPPRTPAALRPLSPSAYTVGLCRTSAAQSGLSCSVPLLQRVLLPVPRRDLPPNRIHGLETWPSPRHARLGSRIVSLTRRQASLDVAARAVAPLPRLSPLRALDTALHQSASRPQVAVCYRALRRLPGRDSHPLELHSMAPPRRPLARLPRLCRHDAPRREHSTRRAGRPRSASRATAAQYGRSMEAGGSSTAAFR